MAGRVLRYGANRRGVLARCGRRDQRRVRRGACAGRAQAERDLCACKARVHFSHAWKISGGDPCAALVRANRPARPAHMGNAGAACGLGQLYALYQQRLGDPLHGYPVLSSVCARGLCGAGLHCLDTAGAAVADAGACRRVAAAVRAALCARRAPKRADTAARGRNAAAGLFSYGAAAHGRNRLPDGRVHVDRDLADVSLGRLRADAGVSGLCVGPLGGAAILPRARRAGPGFRCPRALSGRRGRGFEPGRQGLFE